MSHLTACSKNVQWEEEVPLNNGEVIWVKRSVKYELGGSAGNPFDISYLPNWTEKLEFFWNGKNYIYEGDAHLMLLAISPNQQAVLVARAADKGWHWKHNYKCTVPFYVQFVSAGDGKSWTWGSSIDRWLFDMPHNLMRERKKPAEMGKRFTTRQRNEEDEIGTLQDPSSGKIDPAHIVNTCFK